MSSRIVFQQQLQPRPGLRSGTSNMLIDLGFPCHLKCHRCERTAPAPRLYHVARRQLLCAASDLANERICAVFFGGDAFALPKSFEALLTETKEACARRSARFDATVLSDGTSWSSERVRRFAELGVRQYQVTLDGTAEVHDQLRPARAGGSTFERILRSLKYHRENVDVVVRMDAALGIGAVERLACVLDYEGLFACPHPITLFVARRASYSHQSREMLALHDSLAAGAEA